MLTRILRLLRLRWRYRSAVSGKWVGKAYAEQHPDTTIKERVK